MGYLLKEALKTLCGVNQWSYAVFWKIGCQNPKLLILEECYCGLPGLSGNAGLAIDFQDYDTLSSITAGNRNLQSDLPAREKVHLLVNKMMTDSNFKIIGEGLVGRVVFTGNYQWMLSENYCREPHPPEVLKEAFQQFSAGMQTVTVIPVHPHGVVQFGSHLKIPENIGFVNDVSSLILQLGQIPGVLQSDRELLPLESKMVNPSLSSVGCSSQTSVIDCQTSFVSPCHLKPRVAKITRAPALDFSSRNQYTNGAVKAEVVNPSNGLKFSSFPKPEPFRDSVDRLTSKNAIRADNNIPSFVEVDKKQKIEHLAIQTRSGDDLFDVLGPDYKNKLFNNLWNSSSTNESEKVSYLEASSSNLDGGILSFAGPDHLLNAVVSKSRPLDDNVSCGTTLTNTSGSSGSKSPLPYGRFGVSDRSKGELLGVPKYVAKGKEDTRTYSQGSCVFDPWAEKGRDVKGTTSVGTGYSNKPNVPSKPNRKRLKPGENPRPRPKDRQMIQDRVKELREIVPNSAKCSIDALLERTIKHMLFLQGVTKHADKLKQTGESKIIDDDGGLLLKDNSGGGATWAYEVGSQSMVCPIIVEDLNQPHQMLVEMLCEERGLFLEIADIVRGLGLTILKGLMENRNDKIWARFTVEANRNVTRMEIFLSLVRLLDQNPKTGIPQPDKTVREFNNQAASGPTTGGCVAIC